MAINLSRNTRLWVSTVTTGHNNSNTFEIPVQEGYSLSQSVATADVSVEEAGPKPTRGGKRFNTNLDPVEWSFSTYFNPYSTGIDSNVYAVDMLMWHALATSNSIDPDFDGSLGTGSDTVGDSDSFIVDFNNNSAHELTKLYMYFKIDNNVYLVSGCQVGQAEISIDISDISQVAWSGSALSYTRLSSTPEFVSAAGNVFDAETALPNTFVAISADKKYLVNKLSTMAFTSNVADGTTQQHYDVPLTSGSITINNNITYLTPNTLSEVDAPIGSFTGSFEVTGSFEAYMRNTNRSGNDSANKKGTTELLEDMLSNTSEVTNITNVDLFIGGEASGAPQIKISMPRLHIAVPSLNVDDVISTGIEFKAVPNDPDLKSGSEITIEMSPEIA